MVGARGEPGLVTAKFLPGAPIVRGFNAIGGGQAGELAHRAGEPVGCRSRETTRRRSRLPRASSVGSDSSPFSSAGWPWADTWSRGRRSQASTHRQRFDGSPAA